MIDVVSDANIVLKWFREESDEGQLEEARALLGAHIARTVGVHVLDLTRYEVGNALLRGRANDRAEEVNEVIRALTEACPAVTPSTEELALATTLAERHRLTMYEATYAAVAQSRSATLVTLDRELLNAGLGVTPAEFLRRLKQ